MTTLQSATADRPIARRYQGPLWRDDYRPLRVVAHLAAPVAILPHEGALPLDSLLEWAANCVSHRWCAEARVRGERAHPRTAGWPAVLQAANRTLPSIDSEPINFVLPIKRMGHRDNKEWFWAASWAVFPGLETDRTHWNKRFDGCDPALTDFLDFGGRSERVPASSGRYKPYHMPVALVVARTAEWHVLGALDGIARLLAEVTHLGHKRGHGHGAVTRFEVFAEREDRSCWRENGTPARALPAWFVEEAGRSFDGLELRNHALRAPCWHPSRQAMCAVPG